MTTASLYFEGKTLKTFRDYVECKNATFFKDFDGSIRTPCNLYSSKIK